MSKIYVKANVCVFDNPATWHREAWKDGRLVASMCAEVLSLKGFDGCSSMFFGLNIGRVAFAPGLVVGDIDALPAHVKKNARPVRLGVEGLSANH
jgi:hypothetical protein